MRPPGQFRLLTLHYGLYQFAVASALGFAGAYLLQLGFSLPQALACYAGLLAIRCVFRFIGLGIVRRVGFRRAVALGALVGALQFWPFVHAQAPLGLALWRSSWPSLEFALLAGITRLPSPSRERMGRGARSSACGPW